MSRAGCLGLMVSGTVLMAMSLMVMLSQGAAASAAGTYHSTIAGEGYVDQTWPADFYYDVTLTLGTTSSFRTTCTDVIINQPGWEDALSGIGKTFTYSLTYTDSGSSVTLRVNGGDGHTYTFPLTLSGNRLYGNGQYTDSSGTVNTWRMDVTRGGGGGSGSIGSFGFSGTAAAAGGAFAVGGFLAGFAASLLPPPRFMGGSILPPSNTQLGTPYAPSQSITSFRDQTGAVTRPLPDVPRMRFGTGPIQFPNVEMGKTTEIRPTEIKPTDTLAKRFCQNCGAKLTYTAAGWGCPGCGQAPRGGLDP